MAASAKRLPLIPADAWDHLAEIGRADCPPALVVACRQLLRSLDRVPLFSGDDQADRATVIQLFHFHTQLKAAIESCMARRVCGNTMLAAPLSGLVKLHVRMQDAVAEYRARLDLALLMLKTGCVPDEIRLAVQIAHVLILTQPDSDEEKEEEQETGMPSKVLKQKRKPQPDRQAVSDRLTLAGQLLDRAETSLATLEEAERLHLFNAGLLSCDLCVQFGVADLCSSENPLPQSSEVGEALTPVPPESAADVAQPDANHASGDLFEQGPVLSARSNGSAVCVALLSRRLGTLLMQHPQKQSLERAVAPLKQAVDLLERHLPPDHAAYAELPITRVSLGVLQGQFGQLEGQTQLASARLEFLRAAEHHPHLLQDPGFVEQYAKFLNLYACALAAPPQPDRVEEAEEPASLSQPQQKQQQDGGQRRFTEAKALADEAIELIQAVFGASHESLVQCCSNLGQICEDFEQPEQAAVYYRRALDGLKDLPQVAKAISEQLLILNKLLPVYQQRAVVMADEPAQQQEWTDRAIQAEVSIKTLQAAWDKLSAAAAPAPAPPADSHVTAPAAGAVKHCARPSCGLPDTPALPLKRCAGCRKVWYCGATCQKKHFKQGHKKECQK